jgi:hypothetical protein
MVNVEAIACSFADFVSPLVSFRLACGFVWCLGLSSAAGLHSDRCCTVLGNILSLGSYINLIATFNYLIYWMLLVHHLTAARASRHRETTSQSAFRALLPILSQLERRWRENPDSRRGSRSTLGGGLRKALV